MAPKAGLKKPKRARRKKAEPKSKGLEAKNLGEELPEAARTLAEQIQADGGQALALYREPLGGHPVVLAALPLDKVQPTPYQRDRSEAHVKKLANAMERVGRFLDPIIAVREDGGYWTPNGNHRLGALQLLGMKTIIALVLPEHEIAFKILALNTEKAHNLKERSLEVIRMYRDLMKLGGTEAQYIDSFDEPHFATLGLCYEQRPRFAGSAFAPIVKRLELFLDEPLDKALEEREQHASLMLELDDAVTAAVEQLRAHGLQSPYLRNFVVARINFLRFKKEGELDFEDTLRKMIASAKRFDASKVRREDLAKSGGAPGDAEE